MTTALVLPGQGSQRPGAGLAWQGAPGWSLVDCAGDVLGRDVSPLLLTASADELRPTREAQLATFMLSLLVWQALPDLQPAVVAGHSLGELTALVVAGVLTPEDGVRLVDARGAAMQAAADVTPGTMAAVLGLDEDAVALVVEAVPGAWIANLNAPAHVVISGTVQGVAEAAAALKAAGARRVLSLPVGGAFHSPLMAPARAPLQEALQRATYDVPGVPVLSSVTAATYEGDVAGTLSRQLTAPVRWVQVQRSLPAFGVDRVVELGAGGVLAGLARRTLPDVEVHSIATPEDAAALRG